MEVSIIYVNWNCEEEILASIAASESGARGFNTNSS